MALHHICGGFLHVDVPTMSAPHGTKPRYNRGCRRGQCPRPPDRDCTAANAAYTARHRRSAPAWQPALGVTRRLQALQALGWPTRALAAALGVSRDRVRQLTRQARSERVTHATAARVAELYNRLSMTPGPDDDARARALERGWAPPLAWDDEDLDDPDATPYTDSGPGHWWRHDHVDPVVVQRCLAGERVRANRAERAEVRAVWTARGRNIDELDRLLGWNCWRDIRAEKAEGDETTAA